MSAISDKAIQRGLSGLSFTVLAVQLSALLTGWVAIKALSRMAIPQADSVYSSIVLALAEKGPSQVHPS